MSQSHEQSTVSTQPWPSAVPPKRWWGFRRDYPGLSAFQNLQTLSIAQQSELLASFADHERIALGRLLSRGQKIEIEGFLRTHGANPLFDPQAEIDISVGVAKADTVDLALPPSREALDAILDGLVVHLMFQAGEATRFNKGPFYTLKPTFLSRETQAKDSSLAPLIDLVDRKAAPLLSTVRQYLVDGELGPKQSVMIRAALRRAVEWSVQLGYLNRKEAVSRYQNAMASQKLIYFVNRRQDVNAFHDKALHENNFFGFNPAMVVTIEQELVPGIRLDEEGNIFLRDEDWAQDAGGHLCALIQAARVGDFVTYDSKGQSIKPMDIDAFGYLADRGGKYINIVRINDMDRHTVEIVNPRSLSYALQLFACGYVNAIEAVANPTGQKGGTGTIFGDPEIHILTETHENTFPALSRVFEMAMRTYLEKNGGQNPAYNAMRQWADLTATRRVVREFGGRVVFVPRVKTIDGRDEWYIGIDIPMGDLSLLGSAYPSRMFQFIGAQGKQLAIHDMKQLDQLSFYLRTLVKQLEDPFVLAAVRETVSPEKISFDTPVSMGENYGAPAPELF